MFGSQILGPEQLLRRHPFLGSIMLGRIRRTMRQTYKCPWKTKTKDKYKGRCFYTPALHGEELTRRDLLGHLDFLEGALCFGSCILRALAGLRRFRLLRLTIALQGLKSLYRALELLLRLANPGLVLLARGAFLGRFVLGLS